MLPKILQTAFAIVALSVPANADGFQQVSDRSAFLNLVDGRALTRTGISLDVRPTGQIEGRAFGTPVTGAWRWDKGYFCRDLYFGQKDLGANCQMVKVKGKTMRFILDRGAGEYADLRLR